MISKYFHVVIRVSIVVVILMFASVVVMYGTNLVPTQVKPQTTQVQPASTPAKTTNAPALSPHIAYIHYDFRDHTYLTVMVYGDNFGPNPGPWQLLIDGKPQTRINWLGASRQIKVSLDVPQLYDKEYEYAIANDGVIVSNKERVHGIAATLSTAPIAGKPGNKIDVHLVGVGGSMGSRQFKIIGNPPNNEWTPIHTDLWNEEKPGYVHARVTIPEMPEGLYSVMFDDPAKDSEFFVLTRFDVTINK